MSITDTSKATIVYSVEKFLAKNTLEIETKALQPYEGREATQEDIDLDPLLNEGIAVVLNFVCGLGSPTAYNNTNAYLGVGNDATAPSATQTGLLGASKAYKGMNATYPQISAQDTIFQADFIDGEGEFDWLEETVVNAATDAGDNLCRQNTSLGTKPAGQTWRLTATITWS